MNHTTATTIPWTGSGTTATESCASGPDGYGFSIPCSSSDCGSLVLVETTASDSGSAATSSATTTTRTAPQHTSATAATGSPKRVTMSPQVQEPSSRRGNGGTLSSSVVNAAIAANDYDNMSSTKSPSETEITSGDVDLEMGGNGNSCKTNKALKAALQANHIKIPPPPPGPPSAAKVDLTTQHLPRLVLRNRPFHQSANKVSIEHNQGYRIFALLQHNWFHVFLRWPTSRSLPFLMSIWTGAILFFAAIYVWYDHLDTTMSCGLGQIDDPMTFAAAFAFSLETCTTVGYGLPHGINSFFEDGCSSLQIIIYLQMAWSMIFNAILLAFLYARLGRAESRGAQVIYSNKALVSQVDGQVRFQVRLFDADVKHPVVEAHVRLYAVMKHRPVPRPLRLLQPDDELGGMLFLSFPTVVNHHVDLYSLLHPPTPTMSMAMDPHGLVLRQVDGTTAGRDDVICPVCGESYGTLERWKNHVRYQQIVEAKDEYPIEGTHLSLNLEEIEKQTNVTATNNLDELKQFFQQNVSEVICVVEGIDPMQSGTFQALQSYRFEDIEWETHAHFAPCMTVVEKNDRKKTRCFQVDLDRYHDIVPDEEAIANAKAIAAANLTCSAASPAASAMSDNKEANPAFPTPPRPRHRRVKTVSRKQSDCLFLDDAAIASIMDAEPTATA